ncbi:subtilisin-like protein [Trametes coccinea BRFM310]|uniref:tripeptidyl-peptidase II n=1 Tax=Trametes coccinea (strain BRFM310) TaxID=1353009 RepID=A0A1Y2J4D5_TRAC3|nr:subtilisin-like protein [Trametes coccinea BRFM310]
MVRIGGLLVVALAPFALAEAHTARSVQYHETRQTIPRRYSFTGAAPANHNLKLRFALKQSDPDGLIDALYDVSDPDSPKYGQHLSKSEVEKFVAPKPEAMAAVTSWLLQHNLSGTPLSPAGDWVGFELPVGQANDLFSANFSAFVDTSTGTEVVRTLAYALPAELQGHVDFVHPTVSFADPTATKSSTVVATRGNTAAANASVPAACINGTTPACLQSIYNIPSTPAVNKDNQLGVTGRQGGVAGYTFLETFLETLRPDIDPTTNFTVIGIDGGSNNQSLPSISEGNLDIQYTIGVATGVPVVYIFVGSQWQDGPEYQGWLDQANYLLSQENPPHVMTTSWGAYEETEFSQPVTERICQAYAQLGARGVSFLVASLDEGVGCSPANMTNFEATFPSNCPYVTSVGGTDQYDPEIAWFASSGGFTNYFPIPKYQQEVVSTWLAKYGSQNAGRYNASGRGFPDISALAVKYLVYEGFWLELAGTSAASPVIASMIALVNDRLRSVGKPPLGWLNPLLYSKKGIAALTDVVAGNSSITCTEDDVTPRGFDAVPGWDPVTGLGVPSFDSFLALAGL